MITVRPSAERGHFDHGWLKSYHTFSFADYHDPRHMHFKTLRVMNEDVVAPGKGFGMHPHSDMEILTYILSGALEHKDSMGNSEIMRAGDFQLMTAGRGLMHSEFNPSTDEPVHLYQVWIFPDQKGLTPGYRTLRQEARTRVPGGLEVIAVPAGEEGPLKIHQSARVSVASLGRGDSATVAGGSWVQVTHGGVQVGGELLHAGDGASFTAGEPVQLTGNDSGGEALIFELS